MPSEREEVAVIGMACCFAGAPNLRAFWRNVLGSVDAIGDAPERWTAGGLSDRCVSTRRGGYLADLPSFDPVAFGVMPRAVDGAEPEHFVSLQLAADALADAGYANGLPSKDVAVIIGRGTFVNRGYISVFQHTIALQQTVDVVRGLYPHWSDEQLAQLRDALSADLPPFNAETAPGLAHSVMCGRIANRLDLSGPAYTVDAACASSLIAVQHAIDELNGGRVDLALAGGIQISSSFPIAAVFSHLGALSKTGWLKPFHKTADGTLLGEGAGIVVLKRRRDAVRDGDRIYAVISGLGTASDGRAVGLLEPRVEGEELAMRRAYRSAGVDPAAVGLLEAHGTGTPVGDAVEIEAMTRVFGTRAEGEMPTCAVGSVKSMIGHCIPAAGIAGLIKTALSVYHKVLPPTLHSEDPQEALDRSVLYLNDRPRPWISATPRVAAVSAFGFGGINAHLVMAEHEPRGPHARITTDVSPHVFRIPGCDRDELIRRCESVARYARDASVEPGELSAVLAAADPSRIAKCLTIVADSIADLAKKAARAAACLQEATKEQIADRRGVYYTDRPLGEHGGVAMLFPGEGAQYPTMLEDLLVEFPTARRQFDLLDTVFADLAPAPSQLIFPPLDIATDEARSLNEMELAVVSVSTADHAVAAVLSQLGVRADAVVGHSSGEYAALTAAGALDGTDEGTVVEVMRRGRSITRRILADDLIPAGALLAVGSVDAADVAAVLARTDGQVVVAMENCPHQLVLCGTPDAVHNVEIALVERGAICLRLPFDRAYHTESFRAVADALEPFYRDLPVRPPKIPLYSAGLAARMPEQVAELRRVTREQWCSPVRFADTVELLYREGCRIFLEAGPRGNLTAFVRDILRGRPHLALPCDTPSRSSALDLCHVVAQLVAHAVPVDLAAMVGQDPVMTPAELFGDRRPAALGRVGITLSRDLPVLGIPIGFRSPDAPNFVSPVAHGAASAVKPTAQPTGDQLAEPMSAMQSYLRTMENFLDTQRAVMATVLDHPPPIVGPELLARASHEASGPDRVSFRLMLNASRDSVLGDHTLGPTSVGTNPEATALPVLPFAVSLQLILEAASRLDPNSSRLVGVRAHRWVFAPDGDVRIDILAQRTPDGIEVEMLADGHVAATALVCAGAPPGAGSECEQDPVRAPRTPAWSGEALYRAGERHGMFHGRTFQIIERLDTIGDNGAEATFGSRRWDLSSIVDGAGQVLGYWAAQVLTDAFVIFPTAVADVMYYGARAPSPGPLVCRLRVTGRTTAALKAELTVMTTIGTLVARITGWEVRRFPVPEQFFSFRLDPEHTLLAEPWEPAPAGVRVMQPLLAAELLEEHGGIWAEVLAHLVLHPSERPAWHALPRVRHRRVEWLLGRVAVKDAVRALLADLGPVWPADLEVVPDTTGRPHVSSRERPDLTEALTLVQVSLSHSDGRAVAVAAKEGRGIGVDIEALNMEHIGLDKAAFGPDEIADAGYGDDCTERLLQLWCAKEACVKASGDGLAAAGGPRALRAQWEGRDSLIAVSPRSGRLAGEAPMKATTLTYGDLVLAVAIA